MKAIEKLQACENEVKVVKAELDNYYSMDVPKELETGIKNLKAKGDDKWSKQFYFQVENKRVVTQIDRICEKKHI